MAGGDFVRRDNVRKPGMVIPADYEYDQQYMIGTLKNESKVHHLNQAMYIESMHDQDCTNGKCEDNFGCEDYYLDLSNVNSRPSSAIPTDTHRTVLNTKSPAEIRYINSAIFIERVDSDGGLKCRDGEYKAPDETFRFTDKESRKLIRNYTRKCAVEIENNIRAARLKSDKYLNRCKSSPQTDNYCSTSSVTEEAPLRPKGLTFDEWLAVKQQQQMKRRERLEHQQQEKVNDYYTQDDRRSRLDEQREDFKRWLAGKHEQELIKRKELELQEAKLKYEEELKAQRAIEKETLLRAWIKRKDEQAKVRKRHEDEELRRAKEEKQLRKQLSKKAYEEWMAKAKYNPKPVPLNMGIESLRGSVSAMFINPTPWQENIDIRQSSA